MENCRTWDCFRLVADSRWGLTWEQIFTYTITNINLKIFLEFGIVNCERPILSLQAMVAFCWSIHRTLFSCRHLPNIHTYSISLTKPGILYSKRTSTVTWMVGRNSAPSAILKAADGRRCLINYKSVDNGLLDKQKRRQWKWDKACLLTFVNIARCLTDKAWLLFLKALHLWHIHA